MTEIAHLTIVDDVPFEVNLKRLLHSLREDEDFAFYDDLKRLAAEAEAIARPKGVYKLADVEHQDELTVHLDGLPFTSRVLRVNLEGVHRVFPYIATCGTELEQWSQSIDDLLHRFWADMIKEMAMRAAFQALGEHLTETYRPGKRAAMSPGSLEDWPVSAQPTLFALFGEASSTIGVTLTESCLMNPVKSISGLWFPTETGFESCQLCPRANCPGRRAVYDAGLYARQYQG